MFVSSIRNALVAACVLATYNPALATMPRPGLPSHLIAYEEQIVDLTESGLSYSEVREHCRDLTKGLGDADRLLLGDDILRLVFLPDRPCTNQEAAHYSQLSKAYGQTLDVEGMCAEYFRQTAVLVATDLTGEARVMERLKQTVARSAHEPFRAQAMTALGALQFEIGLYQTTQALLALGLTDQDADVAREAATQLLSGPSGKRPHPNILRVIAGDRRMPQDLREVARSRMH